MRVAVAVVGFEHIDVVEADDGNWFMSIAAAMGEDRATALFRKIVATNGMSLRKGHTLLSNLVVAGEVA